MISPTLTVAASALRRLQHLVSPGSYGLGKRLKILIELKTLSPTQRLRILFRKYRQRSVL